MQVVGFAYSCVCEYKIQSHTNLSFVTRSATQRIGINLSGANNLLANLINVIIPRQQTQTHTKYKKNWFRIWSQNDRVSIYRKSQND